MSTLAAAWTRPLRDGRVLCLICPHCCALSEGETARCLSRRMRNGGIELLNAHRTVSLALDPIEKKPLYHFLPGARVLSLGGNGCNLTCDFCQNWSISQKAVPTVSFVPDRLADMALADGAAGVAFTYTEPTIWLETILDTAPRLAERNLAVILVSNGFILPKPLRQLVTHLDAINVDLKSMRDDFYRRHCGGSLAPVLRSLEMLAGRVHLEVTCLLIPGENDSDGEIAELSSFLADLDVNIPLHLSRYRPHHRLNLPPTPVETLLRAAAIARESLNFVYLGNVGGGEGVNTSCPECGQLLIDRCGLAGDCRLTGNRCPRCGQVIAGIFTAALDRSEESVSSEGQIPKGREEGDNPEQ